MASLRSALARSPDPAPAGLIRKFQSETSEIIDGPQPIQARVMLHVVAGLFVILLTISMFWRIDRVVSSSASSTAFGWIVTVDPTIVVQPLDPSIVKTLDIHQGDIVHAGQQLATLDPTFATADVDTLQLQISSLTAQIARAEAEAAQRPFVIPPSTAPGAAGYAALQMSYYQQRKAQFDAQVQAYNQQIAQLKATVTKYTADAARYSDRDAISKEIEQMRATLAANQVGSRLNLLTATDQKLEIERELDFDHNSLIESQHQLDAAVSTRNAFVQQWFGQISQELVTARNSLDAAQQGLDKAVKHQDLVRIQAQEDAVVLQIAEVSVGSVLQPGNTFIELAPLRSPVEAEIDVSAKEVGFLRAGDHAILKLDAFNYIEHGSVEGTVRSISDGASTTDVNNQAVAPYYKVRIALSSTQLKNVPKDFRLIPGMTLSGDIKVGTRSLFFYLMEGVMRGTGEAMREP
jgi:hemolysin D